MAQGKAVTKYVQAEFLQYADDNVEAVREFAREEYFGVTVDGVVLIQFYGTAYLQPLYPGWYLVRYDGDANVRVLSYRNFEATFDVQVPEASLACHRLG